MGKKNNNKGSNIIYDPATNTEIITAKPPKSVPFKDHYARINYLYQVSTALQLSGQLELSRMCMRNMDLITKKTTIRMKPSIKRSYCKRCSTRLINGVTSEHRLVNLCKKQRKQENQRQKCDVLQVKCLTCDAVVRNYPVGANLDYVPFSEKPENSLPVD